MNVTWISIKIVLQINSRIFKYCLHYDVYLTVNLQWNKQPSLLSWIMWNDKCNNYFLATEWNAQLTEVFQALANASSNLDLKWSRASSSDRSSFCERLNVLKLLNYLMINTCSSGDNFSIFLSITPCYFLWRNQAFQILSYTFLSISANKVISNAINVKGKVTLSKCHRKMRKTLTCY